MTKTRFQKSVERRHRIVKARNLKANAPRPRYLLMADPDGKGERPVMTFKNDKAVQNYIASVEKTRSENTSDIIAADIVTSIGRKLVRRIAPHKMTDPALIAEKVAVPAGPLGSAGDKLA